MSYEKQNFVDGQVLEAEHLNHIEDGLKELEESGGSATIVDCATLPTENINENAIYRLVLGAFIQKRKEIAMYVCQCVDSLPAVGELLLDEGQTRMFIYYNISDGNIHGYLDDNLASVIGAPSAGWMDISPMIGSDWGGVITSKDDDPNDGKLRLLLSFKLYHHKGGDWFSVEPVSIGWSGEGAGAEVFNFQGNTASGVYAHAEGGSTVASGDHSHAEGLGAIASAVAAHAEGYQTEAIAEGSHAEGRDTEAVGDHSHAEGFLTDATGEDSHAEGNTTVASGTASHAEGSNTHADGPSSHAEGDGTEAIGEYSHAEGNSTVAEGMQSHAEGYETHAYGVGSHVEGLFSVARGAYQHVHGMHNVEDEVIEGDDLGRGKYVTIVGNGKNSSNPSNAHTLDWGGNAWYAGSVECKFVILTSPNGNRFKVTVSDSGELSAATITE